MTVYVSVALVASDARRAGVEAAIALLTPSYTAALTIPVCAIAEGVTWQTPATHWYTNGASVDQDIASVWQGAAGNNGNRGVLPDGFSITDPEAVMDEEGVLDALQGIPIWTGVNVTDALQWADANLVPLGLMRVPPNNDI